ncbi:MAG: DUF2062 domain-containing protein [Chthoniobacterales bacterium]|nr:DUF2062 domain-containing protein [Chthoniobacterales bacterium]
MIRSIIHHLHELWERFIKAHDCPHAMAGGMAIGVFFGFIPVFGFKTLLALGTSLVTRCNLIAAVVGVTLHDIFCWSWPFLYRLEFQIGHWILSNPHQFAPKLLRTDFKLSEILQWENFITILYPWLLGSIIIAIPATIIAYIITLIFMCHRERKKAFQRDQATQACSNESFQLGINQ